MPITARVPPFNTTLMGVVRAVADAYRLPVSDAMLFGLGGHAFKINIHDTLCPSGPYCWDRKPFYQTLSHVGIQITESAFMGGDSTAQERRAVEADLLGWLDRGEPCGLVNLEYQLITGSDETGFLTSQPWPGIDFPPGHLTFGSWQEMGAEIHVTFLTFARVRPAPFLTAVKASLRWALDPNEHASHENGYHSGLAAYDAWIKAVEDGYGGGHGNWWNGQVWSECRRFAARYARELAEALPEAAPYAADLETGYLAIADNLARVSDKALPAEEKVGRLREARSRETACLERLGRLLEDLNQRGS